ncbi:uncharacterized protein V1510DRAFT_428162 [Dipodascopsis tothii]|uniref:uncharacterized protein n=1 Tax=Dipodascopsis tothii TaxID=44089 RepID=UPI0034CECA09
MAIAGLATATADTPATHGAAGAAPETASPDGFGRPEEARSGARPALPQSEELKYRQKCKDLKKRIREIEEHNDVLTIRLSRAKRAAQRMRLERALLLEKLEEKTLLRVDDSDGSPSPPASPARKRRRSDASSPEPSGPSFHAFSNADARAKAGGAAAAGAGAGAAGAAAKKRQHVQRDPNAPKRPQNAYIIFCDHEKERVRATIEKSQPGEAFDLTKAMAEAWRDLGDDGRKPYYELYDAEKARYNREMEAYIPPGSMVPIGNSAPADKGRHGRDDDSGSLTNDDDRDDDDDLDPMDDDDDVVVGFGGFTAVNSRRRCCIS